MIARFTFPKFIFNKSVLIINAFLCLLILLLIVFVNKISLIAFVYFLFIWVITIYIFDREVTKKFILAFLINSLFICLFVFFQSNLYPNSYGTTSPLNDSWTDDSYFFSLLANKIPVGLETRDNYFEYNHPFSSFLRFITPFGIYHPLDILLFQSGVMATMAIYTSKLSLTLTNNKIVSNRVFYFILFSPFLLFNGGLLLIRDTEVATLFVLSVYSLIKKNYFIAFLSMFVQFFIREGTAFFILPLFITFFLLGKSTLFKTTFYSIVITVIVYTIVYYFKEIALYFIKHSITTEGRDFSSTIGDGVSQKGIFYKVQNLSFIQKIFVAPVYIFLYPFLSFAFLQNVNGFDIRSTFLNILYPIESIILFPLFFAGFFKKNNFKKKHSFYLKLFFIVGFIMLGLISLQTRHKTVFMPFFYYFVALGTIESSIVKRMTLLIFSILWFCVQIVIALK